MRRGRRIGRPRFADASELRPARRSIKWQDGYLAPGRVTNHTLKGDPMNRDPPTTPRPIAAATDTGRCNRRSPAFCAPNFEGMSISRRRAGRTRTFSGRLARVLAGSGANNPQRHPFPTWCLGRAPRQATQPEDERSAMAELLRA